MALNGVCVCEFPFLQLYTMFVLGYVLFLVFNAFSVKGQQEDSLYIVAMLALQFLFVFSDFL